MMQLVNIMNQTSSKITNWSNNEREEEVNFKFLKLSLSYIFETTLRLFTIF